MFVFNVQGYRTLSYQLQSVIFLKSRKLLPVIVATITRQLKTDPLSRMAVMLFIK